MGKYSLTCWHCGRKIWFPSIRARKDKDQLLYHKRCLKVKNIRARRI